MEKIVKTSKKKISSQPEESKKILQKKNRTVFDHINHIRETKDPNYYNNLSDEEKLTFNKYIILLGLGMDAEAVPLLSIVSKYFDLLPNDAFYTVCCDLTPLGKKYTKWIKSSRQKLDRRILDIITNHYKIGIREAHEYTDIFLKNEDGIQKLYNICSMHGMAESEFETILMGK